MRRLIPSLPRAAWQLLAAGSLSAVANGLTYPFLVVYLHRVRDLPLGLAGLAVATIAAAAIVVNLAAGPLVDRLGPRRVVAAMLLLGAAGSAVLAFAASPALALVGSALFGAGLTTGWVGLQQVLAAVVLQEQRGDVFAVQFALLNAGIGAGGLAAGLLVDFDRPATFEAAFLAAACCYLLFAAVLPLVSMPARPTVPRDARRGGYVQVVRDRRFRLVFALNLLFVGIGVGQIENAFPAFATEVGGASPRILGLAFAADTLVIVLFQFWVTARMRGRRRTRGLMLESVFWAAAWATALLAAALAGPYLFVAVAVLFACAEMLHSPTIPAIVNDLAPDHLRGRYNAAGGLSWQTARVLGATSAGQLLGLGLGGPLLAAFIGLSGLGALLALRLERELPAAANGMLTEEMQVALPASHPRASAGRLRLRELKDERWLVGTAPVGVGVIRAACVAAGFEPTIACEVDDPRVIAGLVAAGVGITFTSPLRLEDPAPGLVAVPLVDAPTRHIFASLLPSEHRLAAVEAILELLHESALARRPPGASRK